MTNRIICRVAIAAPLHRLFDYWSDREVVPGARVLVPFGRRRVVGVVMEIVDESPVPAEKIKVVVRVLDEKPLLDKVDLSVLRWAAQYYRYPTGEVVLAALPRRLRDGEPAVASREGIRLTASGLEITPEQLRRAPRQLEALELLRGHDDGVSLESLRRHDHRVLAAARRMMRSGWVEVFEETEDEAPDYRDLNIAEGPELTPSQDSAVAAIDAASGYETFLLFGVTGSGKTEVYLRTIEKMVRSGRQTLILVPEIALTPQLVQRFERRFEAPIVSLHSGLNDNERLAAWRAARRGSAAIVIGTRSAVFTPLARPGLFIVDEEHDGSLKQQDGFRYNARDVAIYRARALDVPIVLGSATPTLETLHNATQGRYHRLDLPYRAGPGSPPSIHLIDLRREPVSEGLSTGLMLAMGRHLADGGQIMVFLNRRGYAPAWFCSGCGAVAQCRQCDAKMTYHQRDGSLRCHHCGARRPAPSNCEECNEKHKPVGQGTERIEDVLARRFPQARVARLDRDTTRRRGALEDLLTRMRRRQIDILVGTQMLTKGHHFPEVSMVGVVYADHGLFSTDFRATERLAQTIVQVCGRAGRGTRPGEVYIQTAFPEHPLLKRLIDEGYESFAQVATEERQRAGWPPFSHLALLRARAPQAGPPHDFLAAAAAELRRCPGIAVLGPASAPMSRRANQYHAQLLLQSTDRRALNRALFGLTDSLAAHARTYKARYSIDIDPIDLF